MFALLSWVIECTLAPCRARLRSMTFCLLDPHTALTPRDALSLSFSAQTVWKSLSQTTRTTLMTGCVCSRPSAAALLTRTTTVLDSVDMSVVVLTSAAHTEAAVRGWMWKLGGKAGAFKRKRWFVLRGDVISYYKNKVRPVCGVVLGHCSSLCGVQGDDFTIGSIPLNSLCGVIPPDEAACAQKGEWSFVIHSRRKSYVLSSKTQADCNRWVNAIQVHPALCGSCFAWTHLVLASAQDVIDNSPAIETPTDKLIDELKIVGPDEVQAIYAQHKVRLSWLVCNERTK